MTEPVCPYCRMPFEESSPPRVFCTACGTPHHEDCYHENGGCTVFGCSRAPADDPKLQVSQNDLRAVNLPAQPYIPSAQPYAPAQPFAQAQPYAQAAYSAQQTPVPRSPYGSSPLGLSMAAAPAPAISAPADATTAAPSASQGVQPPPGTYFYSQATSPAAPYVAPAQAYGQIQRSRTTFIVLGIFLGALGAHNFYAGYTGKAVGQLCLTVLTLGYLSAASWLWAIIEVCIVTKDAQGVAFS
jgi:TM2 domain-containing membrane protein YozV